MRRAVAVASLALSLCLVATSAQAVLITPVKVLDPPGVQLQPFRNDAWVLFTSNSPSSPNHLDAFAEDPVTKTRVRLNATGTQGFAGGFDPGSNTAIYEQTKGGPGSIWFYDLDTDTRTKVPGVNSPGNDYDPRISNTFITFFRDYSAGGKKFRGVYVFDRTGPGLTRIASYPFARFLTNGSVGDQYATWTVCSTVSCSANVYNVDARVLKKIPTVNNRPQYAPVVEEVGGRVYFIRSGFGCGVQVTFFSVSVTALGGTPKKIAALPKGVDTDDEMSLWPNPNTNFYDLQFIRVNCTGSTAIWSVPGVASAI